MSRHKQDINREDEKQPVQTGETAPQASGAQPGPEVPPVPGQAAPAETGAAEASVRKELQEMMAKLEAANAEIADLRAKNDELNDRYLRKVAEEVNFRKRMLKDKDEAQRYALSSILGDLVPVLDDFDRGLVHAEQTKSYDNLLEGIALIRRQLSQLLENKYFLKRFDSKGEIFDPARHEALFAEPGDVEEPVVSEEYLPGYMLHERVIRFAKVRVKMPAKQKPADGSAEQEEGNTAGQAGDAGSASR